MAVTSVSIGPGLRAWIDSGLTHVLLDETVAEFEAAAVSERNSNNIAVFSPSVAEPAESSVPSSKPIKPMRTKPDVTPGPTVGGISTVQPKAVSVAAALAFASSKDIPRSPLDWPEPWAGWFAKTAPASVLWTYHELGADVTGIGHSRERSSFFKSLIGELGLPKGSSVFWPSAMPSADASLQADASLFASGLRLLMPRVVVVFGDSALEDMDLSGKIKQFGQVMVEGKLLVLLPGIEELLHGEAQRSSAVSLLRALFSTVNFG